MQTGDLIVRSFRIIYRPIGTIQVGNIVTGIKKINFNSCSFLTFVRKVGTIQITCYLGGIFEAV